MCVIKNIWVMIAEQRVSDKKPSEKEDFLDKEKPHAELTRIELLLGRIKVMRNKTTMPMIIMVII